MFALTMQERDESRANVFDRNRFEKQRERERAAQPKTLARVPMTKEL